MLIDIFASLQSGQHVLKTQDHGHFTAIEIKIDDFFLPLVFNNVASGVGYSQAVVHHAEYITAAHLLDQEGLKEQDRIAIVPVPRGGIPVGLAVMDVLMNVKTQLGLSEVVPSLHISQEKHDRDNLFPTSIDFDNVDTLMIVDGIVGTGNTFIRHLEQIPEDWSGAVTFISNASAQMGIDEVKKFTMDKPYDIHYITGKVYPYEECKWVKMDGKDVYFVGMDEGIPDFGEYVSPDGPLPPPPWKKQQP